jgi:YVTN family beta-propeller protein
MRIVQPLLCLPGLSLVLLAAGCASDPTSASPSLAGTSDLLVHPVGNIVATTPLGARPFGAAISSAGGVVLVTQLDASTVAKGPLSAATLPTPIAVGLIPTNVKFDDTRETAFVTNQFDQSVGFIRVGAAAQPVTVSVPMSTFNLAFCTRNRHLYVTGPGTSVYILDVQTRALVDSIPTFAVTNGIATNAGCSRIYVSDESNGRVLEIDPASNQIVRTLATGGAPKDLGVSREGRRLYIADETGSIQVWDLRTGQPVVTIPLPAGAFGLAVSPDGKQVYAGMPYGAAVVVLETQTNTIVNTIPTGGMPRKIAFDPTGATAIVANEAGWVDYVQ